MIKFIDKTGATKFTLTEEDVAPVAVLTLKEKEDVNDLQPDPGDPEPTEEHK